jgi:AraC-like DNA-binding protein
LASASHDPAPRDRGIIKLRLDTDQLAERDRIELTREAFAKRLMHADIEPLEPESFRAEIMLCQRPGLAVGSGAVRGVIRRTTELNTDGNDNLILSCGFNDSYGVDYRGSTLMMAPGDWHVGTAAEPFSFTLHGNGRCGGIHVPRKALDIPDLEDRLGKVIPRENEAIRLLKTYVASVRAHLFASDSRLGDLATRHIHDLVTLALGGSRDSIERAERGGLRAARLAAIKEDIRASIGERDTNAETLAARHRISPRYIRKLFESEGSSLSEYVLEQKLQRAHALLESERHAPMKISDIAFAAGFGDLSYFNRSYRRRFGHTPSDMRQRAAERG